MGTTTHYGFPSPDPDDPPQTPLHIDQLADAVDAAMFARLEDTGWQDVTVAGGFSGLPGTEKPQIRRVGKLVHMRGGWSNTGLVVNAERNIGQLPAGFGFEPTAVNENAAVGTSVGSAGCIAIITAGGAVLIRTGGTLGAYYKLTHSWFAD